jgi:ABC-2 type transport system ATP-binding protein
MQANIVEIQALSRRFGKREVLSDIDLTVPRGGVLGLVGENGAGKTTLLKHMLGLFKAQRGSVRVFGLDPVADPKGVLSRIGYLSEDRDMPEWMRVGELLNYTRAFYPDWDPAFADELLQTFDLDPNQRIKSLSRGQCAKTGLLTAMAYRPDLLLFDEPSSGLDPVVRRDILSAIIRTITEEGRTVVLSSHLLDEVERVADTVVMIHHGKPVLTDSMESIRAQHHRLVLVFKEPCSKAPTLPGALSVSGGPHEWVCCCQAPIEELEERASQLGARIAEQSTLSLDEIFVARVRG